MISERDVLLFLNAGLPRRMPDFSWKPSFAAASAHVREPDLVG
jgi:hypothetical protein